MSTQVFNTFRNYTTNFYTLDPWFITGFTDAEGSFIINVNEKKDFKNKWGIRASFKISLHLKDIYLL